jgi:hypothetical protein
MHESESHQCKSCGSRLVTTLSLKRAVLVGTAGFLVFLLAIFVLPLTGSMSFLPPVWQAAGLIALVAVIYLACSFQIRRGIKYELWLPVSSY